MNNGNEDESEDFNSTLKRKEDEIFSLYSRKIKALENTVDQLKISNNTLTLKNAELTAKLTETNKLVEEKERQLLIYDSKIDKIFVLQQSYEAELNTVYQEVTI